MMKKEIKPMPSNTQNDGEFKSDVGYCKPPKDFQFGPLSGNPEGRPLGTKNRKTIIKEIAFEMHWIMEGGKKVRRTTLELVLIFIRIRAMEDSTKALRFYHKLLTKYDPPEINGECGYLIAPAELTIDEWIAKAEAANMKKKKPK